MRSLVYTSLGLLLSGSLSADVVKLDNIGNKLKLSFNISKVKVEKGDENFSKISIASLPTTNKIGYPSLPFKSVLIPIEKNKLMIETSVGNRYQITSVMPEPAQLKFRCDDCTQPEYVNLTQNVRSTAIADLVSLGDFRGTPLTRAVFYPIKIENGRVYAYPHAEFNILANPLVADEDRPLPPWGGYNPHPWDIGWDDEWDDWNLPYNPPKQNDGPSVIPTYTTPESVIKESDLNQEFLIITRESLKSGLTDFIAHKESFGYNIVVKTLEELSIAESDATTLKNYIHNYYAINKMTYVMLVGNRNLIPTEFVSTSSSGNTPSDLRYYTMGGDQDIIPDVFSARISAKTAEEVKNQLAKTIKFENKDYENQAGYNRHLGIASNEGHSPSDVQYIRLMRDPLKEYFGFSETSLILQSASDKEESEINLESKPESVRSELEKGLFWISYIGHGSGTSWASMNVDFSTAHMNNLAADTVNPIVIDVACANGDFTGKGGFGETFMNAMNGEKTAGAVAYYGGSVNISWHPPAIMAVGMSRMLQKHELSHLGEIILAGHMFLNENTTDQGQFLDNLEWYHLQGDPSLNVIIQ